MGEMGEIASSNGMVGVSVGSGVRVGGRLEPDSVRANGDERAQPMPSSASRMMR